MTSRNLQFTVILGFVAVLVPLPAPGQGNLGDGTFYNLDFEQADLSPIPPRQLGGGPVPVAIAIPGWTAYIGGVPVSTIVQDNATLGDPSIDIYGPNGGAGIFNGGVLEGLYSINLQPGGEANLLSAAILQIGVVPANTATLLFKAAISSPFVISLGGQPLPITALGTGANYTLYGASVPSSMAGQMETLEIAASPHKNDGGDVFDSFSFSSQIVPEPSVLVLFGFGGLALVAGLRAKGP